jgi:excisionase family DNA binding protein
LEGERGENDRVLVTVQKTARRFGVNSATIRRWVEAGRMEGFRIEGERRVYVATE